MILMIINLIRTKPRMFLRQIEGLRSQYEGGGYGLRYVPRSLILRAVDVEACVTFLTLSEATHPLEISHELSKLCRE